MTQYEITPYQPLEGARPTGGAITPAEQFLGQLEALRQATAANTAALQAYQQTQAMAPLPGAMVPAQHYAPPVPYQPALPPLPAYQATTHQSPQYSQTFSPTIVVQADASHRRAGGGDENAVTWILCTGFVIMLMAMVLGLGGDQ